MLKIGLTGGIASGKSTVCTLFEHYAIPIIDADIIARQLVEPKTEAYQEIIETFGSKIILQDETLNRLKLRQLIFSNATAKQQLEAILHPKIRRQLIIQSQQQTQPYCILAIPLLIESEMVDLVDRTLIVDLSPEQQLQRLQHRDNSSVTDAQLIIDSQCSRQQRLQLADDIINNNDSPSTLTKQVEALHQKYSELSRNSCQLPQTQGQ